MGIYGTFAAGHLLRTEPTATNYQMRAVARRNAYDIDFNRNGEIFTYDADMEWDAAMAWYRPTRILHLVGGADYGWRRGVGKLPPYYEDSLPAVLDVGLGSPTGVEFGYESNFPGKWKDALFCADWTYGRIIAVHLQEEGASYTGERETFVSGRPLNVVDLTFGPDGNLYFVTGGMETLSGLYRLKWAGDQPVEPEVSSGTEGDDRAAELRRLRWQLEFFQVIQSRAGAQLALKNIDHEDRFIRHAARVALENQEGEHWVEEALEKGAPAGLLALARHPDLLTRGRLLDRLNALNLEGLTEQELLGVLRAYQVEFVRSGLPDPERKNASVIQLSALFPGSSTPVNHEVCELLVFLEAPRVLDQICRQIEACETTEDLSHYLLFARYLENGWDMESKRTFLKGVQRLEAFPGGKFHQKVVDLLRNEMVERLSEPEKVALAKWLEPYVPPAPEPPAEPVQFVKVWSVEDFEQVYRQPLVGRDFDSGMGAYTKANCITCHRMEGNTASLKSVIGPDLSHVGGRFGLRDLMVSIVHPSRAITDKYRNPAAPNLSTMPPGQINVLEFDEVVDLLAYLQSGGNPADSVFQGEPIEFDSYPPDEVSEGDSMPEPKFEEAQITIEPSIFRKMSAANLEDRDRIFREMQEVLETFPTARFEIVGHGDDTPYASTNEEISLNRARFLAANMAYRGIPREAISFRAVGDKEPSKWGNCRVEILVSISDLD